MAKTSLTRYLREVVSEVEEKASAAYTQQLRAHVGSHGWPEEVTVQLSITYKDGYHQIAYPDKIKDQVLDLEYGTIDSPPSPALRTFMMGI